MAKRGQRWAGAAHGLGPALFVLFCAPACSSGHEDVSGSGSTATDAAQGGDDAGATTCTSLGRPIDTFSLGMKKKGTSGNFTFALVGADPAPPNDPQMNTWTVQVLDATGTPVPDATVSLPVSDPSIGWGFAKNPWMPTMNHGSSVANPPIVNQGGTATIQVDFSMSGYWQTFVYAQSGSTTDSATFSFCLP